MNVIENLLTANNQILCSVETAKLILTWLDEKTDNNIDRANILSAIRQLEIILATVQKRSGELDQVLKIITGGVQ